MKFIVLLGVILMCVSASARSTVDQNATKETQSLYNSLKKIQNKKIMIGHQDATSYGIAWSNEQGQSDIKKVTGDYPAVYGWDIGRIEDSETNLDCVIFNRMRVLIKEAYSRGGINTISWHLNNPYTGGNSWDVSSTEAVKSILPTGDKHEIYLKWLDRVADFMNSLKTDDNVSIPIIFRPFHEHTGSWFWWGNSLCSTQDFVALWKLTVTYLRDEKNVHNLLYAYSPDNTKSHDEYFERYPGDDFVDMLGLDTYHRISDGDEDIYIKSVRNSLSIMAEYSKKCGKPFAFTETGLEGIPIEKWFTDVLYESIEPNRPVYVLLWRNAYDIPGHHYAPYPGHPSVRNFLEFRQIEGITFESDMPDVYK